MSQSAAPARLNRRFRRQRRTRSPALPRDACVRPGACAKSLHRLGLFHADDRVVIAAHAGIGKVGGAAREDLMIGGGHMGVRAGDEARPAIAEVTHGHFSEDVSACMSIRTASHDWPSGHESSSRDTAGNGSSSTGSVITRPMALITSTFLPDAVSNRLTPRPGQPWGQFTGRSSCGYRSMKTSASRWSKA